ncbi:MAG: beta strand repeat-containing protein, partial [Burkholderiales bacterium]
VLQQSDQIANTANVVVSGGTLDIGANSDTVNGVQLTSGNINGTTGTLTSGTAFDMQSGSVSAILGGAVGLNKTTGGTVTLSGANTYTGTTTVSAGNLTLAGGAAIGDAGVVNLTGGTLQVNSAETIGQLSGAGGTTVTLNAGLTFGDATNTTVASTIGGAGGLTKQGTSTVTLSGTNTYGGATAINAGVLRVQSDAALGATGTGTTVLAGAALELDGTGLTIAEPLSLSGSGVSSDGALRNLANANSVTGAITLGGAARINSDAGTLTIATGGITGAGQNLTVGGAGDTAMSAVLGTTSGTLTKDGAGRLTLSGANTYTGTTNVNAGTLVASNAAALGTTANGTSVTAGATLEIANVAIGAEAVTLNGLGVGGNGALTGSGTASLAGSVTLASASAIGAAAANSLAVNGTIDGAFALDVLGGGSVTLGGAVGGGTALASFSGAAGTSLAVNGGLVQTTGAQAYSGATTFGGATTLRTTAGGSISAPGAVTATAGTLTLDSGSGAATFNNVANNFGTVAITSGGTVSLVDANALTLAGASVGSLQAQTLSSDLTVSASITATGAGNSIVLAAAGDFFNSVGAGALNPGPGRWLVYSTSPAGSTENGLVGAAGSALPRLYNRTFGGTPPASITEPGNHLIYSAQPALTVTPDDKSKVYGANDPAQTYGASGFVNDDGVLDNATTAGLTGSFGRAVGESVGTRSITQGSFVSNAGYSITFDGTKNLTITPASLTATVTQSKIYGADDPALPLVVSPTGLINNPAIVTWNGNVPIDDSALTSNATALTRAVGEGVGVRAITAGTFSAPSANYNAPTLAGGSTLTITARALTATVANQTKTYGNDDPALAGINPILTGLVNR